MTIRTTPWLLAPVLLASLLTSACVTEEVPLDESAEGDNGTTDSGDGDTTDTDTDDTDTTGGDGDGDGDGDGICASGSYRAELEPVPSDIIFVLDNSGSMDKEAEWVQENMNAFSQQIAAADIDYRVVVVSSYPDNENGICIDPPLGSGGCPGSDNHLPRFRHVDQKVESNDGLSVLLDTHARWRDSTRPEARKHVVMVSDDNSDMPALVFDATFSRLGAGFDDYQFHGIFCYTDCKSAADVGAVYRTLVSMTGGISGDLCEQDFDPVFDELATAVVAESNIPCSLAMPEAPEGQAVDPDQVAVELVPGAGAAAEELGRVAGLGECAGGGWYYDDNLEPTRIELCPATCERVQGLTDAELNFDLGCLEDVVIE